MIAEVGRRFSLVGLLHEPIGNAIAGLPRPSATGNRQKSYLCIYVNLVFKLGSDKLALKVSTQTVTGCSEQWLRKKEL